jgi:hypothetical protein
LGELQRKVVNQFVGATPSVGWESQKGALATYVRHAMQKHMEEALAELPESGVLDDADAIAWASESTAPLKSLVVECASRVIGMPRLLTLIGHVQSKEDAPSLQLAAQLHICACRNSKHLGTPTVDQALEILKAADCFQQLEEKWPAQATSDQVCALQRPVYCTNINSHIQHKSELSMRLQIMLSLNPKPALQQANSARLGALLDRGIQPTDPKGIGEVGLGLQGMGLLLGFGLPNAGNHLKAECLKAPSGKVLEGAKVNTTHKPASAEL